MMTSTVIALSELETKTLADKGKGVFATTQIPVKTLVVIGRPLEELPRRTTRSFQVDWNRHVDLDEPAVLLNHSCDPNLAVHSNCFGGYNFYAIKPIQPGEELTWDYGMTEAESIAVVACLCGSSQCRQRSVGFTELGLEQQHKLHGKGVARYLSDWYINQLQSRVSVGSR